MKSKRKTIVVKNENDCEQMRTLLYKYCTKYSVNKFHSV